MKVTIWFDAQGFVWADLPDEVAGMEEERQVSEVQSALSRVLGERDPDITDVEIAMFEMEEVEMPEPEEEDEEEEDEEEEEEE